MRAVSGEHRVVVGGHVFAEVDDRELLRLLRAGAGLGILVRPEPVTPDPDQLELELELATTTPGRAR